MYFLKTGAFVIFLELTEIIQIKYKLQNMFQNSEF